MIPWARPVLGTGHRVDPRGMPPPQMAGPQTPHPEVTIVPWLGKDGSWQGVWVGKDGLQNRPEPGLCPQTGFHWNNWTSLPHLPHPLHVARMNGSCLAW